MTIEHAPDAGSGPFSAAHEFRGSLTVSSLRLLRGAREVAAMLGESLVDSRQRELLELIDMAVAELVNRADRPFYVDSYGEADRLLAAGLALLPPEQADSLALRRRALPAALDPALGFDRLSDHLAGIGGLLHLLVEALSPPASAAARTLLAGIVAWEIRLVAPREDAGRRALAERPLTSRLTAEDLRTYLDRRFPDRRDIEVTGVRVIPGGFSKTTTLFEMRDPVDGAQALVMRAEQPITQYHMDGSDIANEYPTVRFAFEAGLPVAEPLWYEGDATRLGTRFFVSRKAAGSNVGDILAGREEVSPETLDQLMRILAQIHATPLDPADPLIRASHLGKWLRNRTMAESARASVLYWREIARKCGSHTSPLIAHGFNWLLQNLPRTDRPPVLVHGDYGMHNIMLDRGQVTAVLDWEASHVGDPADEFILLFKAMSRYIEPARLFDMYLAHGGQPIDPYRLAFFEVLSCLKAPAFGYGALKVMEGNPDSDLKLSFTHYRYTYPIAHALNQAIASAEALRDSHEY